MNTLHSVPPLNLSRHSERSYSWSHPCPRDYFTGALFRWTVNLVDAMDTQRGNLHAPRSRNEAGLVETVVCRFDADEIARLRDYRRERRRPTSRARSLVPRSPRGPRRTRLQSRPLSEAMREPLFQGFLVVGHPPPVAGNRWITAAVVTDASGINRTVDAELWPHVFVFP